MVEIVRAGTTVHFNPKDGVNKFVEKYNCS